MCEQEEEQKDTEKKENQFKMPSYRFPCVALASLVLTWLCLLCLNPTEGFSVGNPIIHRNTGMWVSPSSSSSSSSVVWAGNVYKIKPTRLAMSGPGVLDRPETIEKVDEEVVEDKKTTEESDKSGRDGWEIRLFNDPWNKREFVARCLSTICGKSDTESYQIMMEAHKNGMGVVGRYMFEVAELYFQSLREEGLTVEMIQVDDE